MKAFGSLASHYEERVTTLATCWHITRRDGQVFRYTDHPFDLLVDGVTYIGSTGYTASGIASSARLNVDNLEVSGAIDSATITEADLLAGKWDFAEIRIFEVSYLNTGLGRHRLRRGWLGEIRTAGIGFTAELRGMMQVLQQHILRIVSSRCDAQVGDARCKINLATFTNGTVTGTITSVTNNRSFADSALTPATGWFDNGIITWTSGLNAGLQREVRTYTTGGAILLVQAMPFNVAVTDAYSMTVGCDGTLPSCRDKFNNVINRRAFDFLPGVNRLVSNG